ncbi:MAG: HIT domain-containing protein [Candidatus Eremiobacteraeota bacterium]|nr:HIT domain-containing protein [Candidatus Eremiobacteraeota bacterium]
MDSNCLFCKIVKGEIPATVLYRDEAMIAIVDVNPQAPEHALVMPIDHVANLSDFVDQTSPERVAGLFALASRIGRERGAGGFRTVVNTGPDAGQSVEHLHVHVLSGRPMTWPPG